MKLYIYILLGILILSGIFVAYSFNKPLNYLDSIKYSPLKPEKQTRVATISTITQPICASQPACSGSASHNIEKSAKVRGENLDLSSPPVKKVIADLLKEFNKPTQEDLDFIACKIPPEFSQNCNKDCCNVDFEVNPLQIILTPLGTDSQECSGGGEGKGEVSVIVSPIFDGLLFCNPEKLTENCIKIIISRVLPDLQKKLGNILDSVKCSGENCNKEVNIQLQFEETNFEEYGKLGSIKVTVPYTWKVKCVGQTDTSSWKITISQQITKKCVKKN